MAVQVTYEEMQRRTAFAENEWQRSVEYQLGREPGLVAETAAQLKGLDADARLSDIGKSEQHQAILAHYTEALAAIDARCAAVLDKQQAECEATLARPLACVDQTTLLAQSELIRVYAKSMSAAELVGKLRAVLSHGEPACAAAWCEYLPAVLRAMEADQHDPTRATAIMSARMEAERLAAEFIDAKAPSRPKARERLAEVKQWRERLSVHKLGRMTYPERHHRAFGGLPGHNLHRFGL